MTASTPLRRARELDDLTLARAQHGDAAAFRALVETYQDAVFALVWRLRGRHAAAAEIEDIAQTTFLGVYRALPRFRAAGPAKLSTWILTIATRAVLKSRRGDREIVELEDLPQLPTQVARIAQRSFADALALALDALPAAYRAVFVLHAYHELDHAEIATALEIEPGTVKSRLSRAREHLRAHLKEFAP